MPSGKSKFDLTVAIATGIQTRQKVIEVLRADADTLAKALSEASKKSAVVAPVTSPVLEPRLAAMLDKYGGTKKKNAQPAQGLAEQIKEGTDLLEWLDKIIEVAETGKLAVVAASEPAAEGDDVAPGTMNRFIAMKSFLLALRGHVSEEVAAASKQYRQGAKQRFVDAFSVLDLVRAELEQLSDVLTGKNNATLQEMLQMVRLLKRAEPTSVQRATSAVANGDAAEIWKLVAVKIGRPDLAGRQAVLEHLNKLAVLHLALKSKTGANDDIEALQLALESVEAD
jgi:hypothetical protein